MADQFTGFPVAALDFYDDLEMDNTKTFWAAHKDVRRGREGADGRAGHRARAGVRQAAKVFRPYRDVRFAKDKTPYKTHQGAFVAAGPATGWYVEVGARPGSGSASASTRPARPRLRDP